LRDHFQHFGSIVDAVVLRWPDGRSRGFGYVTFADVASASAALREAHQVGGREVDVKRAVPGTNKLFVGGLPQNTAAAELRQHFEAFGVVSDAVVMIDPSTNRSRGFGFVCFLPGQEGAAAVAAALDQYQNHRIRGKWIEVKSAAPPHKLAAKGSPDASPSSCEAAEEAAILSAQRAAELQHVAAHLPPPPNVVAPPGLAPSLGRAAAVSGAADTCAAVEPEPHKVALLGTPPGAIPGAPPPGLFAPPSDPFGRDLPYQAPGPLAASGHLPWRPGNSAAATEQFGIKSLLTTSGCMQPIKVAAVARVDPSIDAADRGSCDGYFDASRDLQRSLEQLLRLQSQQITSNMEVTSSKLSEAPMLLPFVPADAVISMTKVER
jgi:hypothetical protein